LSRNHEQHSEFFPGSGAAALDYDPDADGWKTDARAELKATKRAVTFRWPDHHRVHEERGGRATDGFSVRVSKKKQVGRKEKEQ
jgi:hypothetical protein